MAKKTVIGDDGKEYTVKEKKPIYKRVWFWVLVIIIVAAAASQMGGDDSPPAANANKPATETAAGTAGAANTEAPAEAAYIIGDTVDAGEVGVVVNSASEQESFESDNQFIDAVTTDGKFIVVEATLTNNAKEAKTFLSNMFEVVDDQGRTFQTLTDANLMMMLGDQNLFVEQVNPGMSRTGVFVFEVPADVDSYSLEVAEGLFSSKKAVIKLK